MADKMLTFVPMTTIISPTFWYKLAELKLDVDGLSDAEKRIYGQCFLGEISFIVPMCPMISQRKR